MEVKSVARVKYSYNIDGVSLSGLSSSNVVTTQVMKKNLLCKKIVSSKFFKPGDCLTYNIVISNTGNVVLNNVEIIDEISNQDIILDSIEITSLNKDTPHLEYYLLDEFINFKLNTLKEDRIYIISYKTIISKSVEYIDSTLKITSDEVTNIEDQSLRLTKGFANVTCLKRVENEYTYLNTLLTYELKLINTGNVGAYNVEVVDELPITYEVSEVLIDNNPINYTLDQNYLSFILKEIKPDSEVLVNINGKIIK